MEIQMVNNCFHCCNLCLLSSMIVVELQFITGQCAWVGLLLVMVEVPAE